MKNQRVLSSLTAPELFVLVILLLFGSFFAFRIPLGAGFDEETHLLRVWEMASFEWIPNTQLSTQLRFPAFYWDNSYRRQAILEPIDPHFWSDNSATLVGDSGYVPEILTTRSVYSPLLLLPQSLVMYLLGRVLTLPALTVFIAIRLVGLLFYILLVWLAVRSAPFAKWLWAILVVSPMAIYQAATVTTDSLSNGIGFLFIGCCLHIASLSQIRWKEWLFLCFLISLLFTAKVNIAFLALLPFIILPVSRFRMKRGIFLLGIATILLAFLEIFGWNSIAYSRFYTALPGSNPTGQLRYIILHPLEAIWIVASDLGTHIFNYLQGWIADYGYGYWGSPWMVYPLYLIALIMTFVIGGDAKPDKRTRIGLFVVFIVCFLATLISLYISYNPVGSSGIQGVHGRYFTVIFPMIIVAVYGISKKMIRLNNRLITRLTIGIATLGILFFSAGMYLAFYVRCGTAYYQPGLCYQPVYKNWSPDTIYFPPISPAQDYSQWIMPKCNGMSSIRVWIDSAGASQDGTTQFILFDKDTDVVKLEKEISNSSLPSKDWVTLSFPIDWQSGGKWHTLTVLNSQSIPGRGIQLASSIRAEYIDAPLFQEGTQLEHDLIFQYGCDAGWKAVYHYLTALINKQ